MLTSSQIPAIHAKRYCLFCKGSLSIQGNEEFYVENMARLFNNKISSLCSRQTQDSS